MTTPTSVATSPDDGRTALAALRRRPGELVAALGVLALGIFVLVDTRTIVVPGSANTLGPRAFPYLVGALLVGAGITLLVGLARGRHGEEEGGEDVDASVPTDWRTVALLVAVFLAHVLTITTIGWPLAATLLFGGSAIVLGARPWWRALALGLVLAVTVQVVFGGLLGLSLPPGPLFESVAVFRG
ncbi:putative tricarboxylic transport membrane protein [Sediminihabitans luteus]|uniref:Putative tricarboxylic transport membrane protein n=1 Tax=Sediminihabitans luteus TaxID=1138585 RepID=A0A2M9D0J4_9CELL|nr:tripartite tricarboxylate transporter TctB family protein [Sediminihabitans luteus]PJJ77657.1 putative tricarboxylic transport membrane protein [Sediminihabitans luteus]GII98557.1 membrane protein [Sediminihabitans luteus]